MNAVSLLRGTNVAALRLRESQGYALLKTNKLSRGNDTYHLSNNLESGERRRNNLPKTTSRFMGIAIMCAMIQSLRSLESSWKDKALLFVVLQWSR